MLAVDLEDQTVVHLVDQIESQCLKFKCIWLCRGNRITGFVHVRNLFLYYMQRHGFIQSFLQFLDWEQIVQDSSKSVGKTAIWQTLVQHIISHFVILDNMWLAIFLAHDTNFFFRTRFADNLCSTHLSTVDGCT